VARSYSLDELAERFCDAVQHVPGETPTVRRFAREVALSPAALYRYVESIEVLAELAEPVCWQRISAGGEERTAASMLADAARGAPGCLTHVADFNRPHRIPDGIPERWFADLGAQATVGLDLLLGYVCSTWQALRSTTEFVDHVALAAEAASAAARQLITDAAGLDDPRARDPIGVDELYRYILDGGAPVDDDVRALVQFISMHHRFPTVREITELFGTTIGAIYAQANKTDLFGRMSVGLVGASAHLVAQRGGGRDIDERLYAPWLMYVAVTIEAPYLAAMPVDWSDPAQNPNAVTLDRLTRRYARSEIAGLAPGDLARMLMGFVMRQGHRVAAGQPVTAVTNAIVLGALDAATSVRDGS
jgi:hypothetical protein